MKSARLQDAKKVFVTTLPDDESEKEPGLPVSFYRFVQRLFLEGQIRRMPPIYTFDPKMEYEYVYRKLGIPVIRIPELYNRLIPTLFSGNGMFSLAESWLASPFLSDKKKSLLAINEVPLDDKNLNKLNSQWLNNRKRMASFHTKLSPFETFIKSSTNLEIIENYQELDKFYSSLGKKLIGFKIEYSLDGQETVISEYFVHPAANDHTESISIQLNHATLFIL